MFVNRPPAGRVLPRSIHAALWICIALVTGTLVAYQLIVGKERIVDQAKRDGANLAWVLEARLDATLRRIDAIETGIVETMPAAAMDRAKSARFKAAIEADLLRDTHKFDEILRLAIFDAAGDEIYGSHPASRRVNISTREYFPILRDDPAAGMLFSDVRLTVNDKRPTLIVARAIRDGSGRFLGVVNALIDLDYFQRLFDSVDMGPEGVIALRRLDDSRLILRRPVVAAEINKPVATALTPRLRAGEKIGSDRVVSPVDGTARISNFRRLENYPLYLFVALSENDLLVPWKRQAMVSVGLALCLLVILGLALYRLRSAGENLEKLSQAIEQSPNPVIMTNVRAEIEYVNESFTRITGYRPEEAVGRNPEFLRSAETPPEAYAAMWECLRAGRPWAGEFVNRTKNGASIVQSVAVAPIRVAGREVTHYIAFEEDITDKKRIAEELDRHRNRLEEMLAERTADLQQANALLTDAIAASDAANKAKSAFLANMSHEIRTPMNAILGMIHLLRRDGALPAQLDRFEKIDAAAQHLLGIINNILDLSKIEAGKFVLSEGRLDLDALLGGVEAMLLERAQAKGLRIVVESDPMPGPLIGDATRLRQALLNYGTNAVKFTERGVITLRLRRIEETADQVLVRFEVEDTGVGMSEAIHSRLFAAFEQADNSTTRKYGGTGLGLAITRLLARLMGGEAGAQSTLGVGSTFWFTARLRKDEQGFAAADTSDAADDLVEVNAIHRGKRILIADDEPLNLEVACFLVEDSGLIADTAVDGAVAVDKAASGTYDLILMDMQMPNIDGLEATRRIRRLPAYRKVPILAMTANAFAEDRAKCIAAGMDDFLVKPVRPAVLRVALNRWLAAGRA